MFSPPTARALAQQHRDDLLHEAARHRLQRQRRAAVLPRTRIAVGRLLVVAGVWVAGRPRPDEVPRLRAYPM